ncbi:MAG: OmpA family protein [Cyclobacteriaceae bacterium]|nr:OmpA family protein [Cyclobacteriaceae bacterium]
MNQIPFAMRGFASALIILIGLSLCSFNDPVPKGEYLRKGYYIVVAAYRIGQEKYMESYADKLNRTGRHARYGYDAGRKFYYIYLDYYTDFDESIQEMLNTRKTGGFTDAWVRIMKEGENPAPVAAEESHKGVEVKTIQDPVGVEEKKQMEEKPSVPLVEEKVVKVVEVNKEKVSAVRPLLKEANVLFYLYNPTNSEPIEGQVEVIDGDMSRLVKKINAHEVVTIPDPKNKTGKVTLIGSSFGYRKVQHDFVLGGVTPENMPEYMEWREDHYVIKFDLDRLHRGDIATLYNVYFFNDAAVMMPESKYELKALLEMMNVNPSYRITLHGHTNGNARGKIIKMGPGRDFFELSQDVVEGSGTAKELSHERAITIKEWLVANGIAPDRIGVKAWGGNRMIHDKNSNNARRNVRVEVEIIED